MLDIGDDAMPDQSPTELTPSAAPWRPSEAHPLPPPSGSYIPIDRSRLLSAASTGVIFPVLVLPSTDNAE
jgi:hypothetical protein